VLDAAPAVTVAALTAIYGLVYVGLVVGWGVVPRAELAALLRRLRSSPATAGKGIE
jgi:hypothetical protein